MNRLRISSHGASALVALIVYAASGSAWAAAVDQVQGTYRDEIAIAAPAFHKIGPELRLTYGSSGGINQLGVGWALAGLSYFERVSPGQGAPRYDGDDQWVIEGQVLLPCTAALAQAASCWAGGTHTTTSDSYLKISLGAAGFSVWQKDGTRSDYFAALGVMGGTFRYYLSRVTDSNGNAVSYVYVRDGANDQYLDAVTYNGATVKLYWETRPDPIVIAVGGGATLTTRWRLRTVDVLVGAARRTAYAIGYKASAATGRSLISSVTPYGSDATVTAGVVIAGTSLPTMSFTYVDEDVGTGRFAPESWLSGTYDCRTCAGLWGSTGFQWSGDFNGDGKTDIATATSGVISVKRSTGTEFIHESWTPRGTSAGSWGTAAFTWAADFDGDGKTDLASASGNYIWVKRSTGTSFLSETWSTAAGPWGTRVFPGDFDGDGKTDLASVTSTVISVKHSTGTAFVPETWSTTPGSWALMPSMSWAGDFNGDGKTDLATVVGGKVRVHRSTGSAFVSEVWAPSGSSALLDASKWWAADFNGDGKTDLATIEAGSLGVYSTVVLLSTGTSFVRQVWRTETKTGYDLTSSAYWSWALDVDGDGRADLVHKYPGGVLGVYRSSGSAFLAEQGWTWPGTTAQWGTKDFTWPGDFDGDGRMDLASGLSESISVEHSVYGPGLERKTGQADQLATIQNGLGATTTFEFIPSSAWPNGNNPPILPTVRSVTQDDGRGHIATTRYVYAGGYVDRRSRQFVGFASVTAFPPALAGESPGPSTETYYDVTAPDGVARPTLIYQRDASGFISQRTTSNYVFATQLPYRSLETQSDVTTFGSNGSSFTTSVTRTFDCYDASADTFRAGYGNLTSEIQWGGVGNQPKTIIYAYAPNPSDYIVGKPSSVTVFAGTTATGAPLSQAFFSYDSALTSRAAPTRGNLTAVSEWLDLMWSNGAIVSANAYRVRKTEYDAYGNVTRTIAPPTAAAPSGAQSTIEYDATYHLFPIRETNELGQTKTATWDYVRGVKLTSTALPGTTSARTTRWEYDAFGRETKATQPNGNASTTTRVLEGNPTAGYVEVGVPGPNGGSVFARTYQDGLGRTYRSMIPSASGGDDLCADVEFDARGNKSRSTRRFQCRLGPSASDWTSYRVDGLNRVTAVIAADGSTTTTAFDLGTTTVTDQLGHRITRTVNSLGQLVSQTEWQETNTGHTTTYAYDAFGRKTKTIDPAGNQWTTVIDSLGRVLQETHPDRGTTKTEYDAANNPVSALNALGERTEVTYDAIGRVLSRTTRAGTTGAATVNLKYDEERTGFYNLGNLTTATNSSGSVTLDYDIAGHKARSVQTMDGVAYTHSWGYDEGGRLRSITYPDGERLGTLAAPIAYDDAGRLKEAKLTSTSGQVTTILSSITYDWVGRPQTIRYGNNTTTALWRDPVRDWTTSISVNNGAGVRVEDLRFTYDLEGNLKTAQSYDENGQIRTGEAWAYEYDALHRLLSASDQATGAHSQTFQYDALGNMTSNSRLGSYAYKRGQPHAVSTAGSSKAGFECTYDSAGRLGAKMRYQSFGGGFGFPPMKLYSSISVSTWTGEGQLASYGNEQYAYDALGARIKRTAASITTRYIGDDYEIASDGTSTKYLVLAGVRIAKRTGTTTSWLHTDLQGSTRVITSERGAVVSRISYRPYGEALSGSPAGGPGYTGQRQDASGLIYLHARYYDPALGRFISPDPSTPTNRLVGLNAYAYAANDPIGNTDVDGLGWFNWVMTAARIATAVFAPALSPLLTQISSAVLSGYAIAQAAEGGNRSFGRFLASAAIEEVAGLSLGGLSDPVSAAVQLGTGFVSGVVQGASVGDAIRSAIIGSVTSLGTSSLRSSLATIGERAPVGAASSEPTQPSEEPINGGQLELYVATGGGPGSFQETWDASEIKDLNVVTGRLWQGSYESTLDRKMISSNQIKHFVYCAIGDSPEMHGYGKSNINLALEDDGFAPTRWQGDAAVAAGRQVAAWLKNGENVLVTCHMGINRSGLVDAIALRVLYPNLTGGQVVSHIRNYRAGALSNKEFAKFIDNFKPE